MDEQRYEIREGVCRAKAAWLCRHETIRAVIGNRDDVVEVLVESLLSPKPIIEDIGPRGGDWGRAAETGAERIGEHSAATSCRRLSSCPAHLEHRLQM